MPQPDVSSLIRLQYFAGQKAEDSCPPTQAHGAPANRMEIGHRPLVLHFVFNNAARTCGWGKGGFTPQMCACLSTDQVLAPQEIPAVI